MSEWAQINLYTESAKDAKPVVRIRDRWGVPEDVILLLQTVFEQGLATPQEIAQAIVSADGRWAAVAAKTIETIRKEHPDGVIETDGGEQRKIINEPMDEGSTSFRYFVDMSTTPWTVVIEGCEGWALGQGRMPAVYKAVKLASKSTLKASEARAKRIQDALQEQQVTAAKYTYQ